MFFIFSLWWNIYWNLTQADSDEKRFFKINVGLVVTFVLHVKKNTKVDYYYKTLKTNDGIYILLTGFIPIDGI